MKRTLAILALASAVAAGGVLGCRPSGDGDKGPEGAAVGSGEQGEPKKRTIAVIPKSMGETFWNTVESGARAAAAKLGVRMEWQGPPNETYIGEQNKIIDNMINLGVDGIALAPLNPKAQRGPVENAVKAGIPVVIFDSAVDGDAHASYVATDNYHGGELGALKMAELLGEGKGKVFIMRFIQGTASTEERFRGFKETAEKAGLEVVAEPFAEDATVAGCKKTAANTLEGFIQDGKLELSGAFACNDRSSEGFLAALEDLRKSGIEVKLRIIGFDFTEKLVKALQDGTADALVVQNPYKMGYLAVETIVKHLRGEAVEKFIDTGAEVATRDRLEKEPELRRLVGLEK